MFSLLNQYRLPNTWADILFYLTANPLTVPAWIAIILTLISMLSYRAYRRRKPESPKRHIWFVCIPIFSYVAISLTLAVLDGIGSHPLTTVTYAFILAFILSLPALIGYAVIMRLEEGRRKRPFAVILITLALLLPVHVVFVYYKMTHPKCCPPQYRDPPFGSYVGPPPFSSLHALFGLPQPGWQPRPCKLCEESEAISLVIQAAEDGDARSQGVLGEMYASGKFVKQDFAAAQKWNLLAANQGDRGGIIHLAKFYKNGTQDQRNYVEAVKWYKKWAEIEPRSRYIFDELAAIYAEGGYGLPPNQEEAYFWSLLASHQGLKEYEERAKSLAKFLSAEAIERAKKRRDDWLMKYEVKR